MTASSCLDLRFSWLADICDEDDDDLLLLLLKWFSVILIEDGWAKQHNSECRRFIDNADDECFRWGTLLGHGRPLLVGCTFSFCLFTWRCGQRYDEPLAFQILVDAWDGSLLLRLVGIWRVCLPEYIGIASWRCYQCVWVWERTNVDLRLKNFLNNILGPS